MAERPALRVAQIVRGDVVEVDLEPTIGSEIRKTRRCVVVQNDVGNKYSPLTIVVPATGAENVTKIFPVCVPVSKGEGGFTKDAVILCDQVRSIDKRRIARSCGRLPMSLMEKVDSALKISLGLK